MSDTTLPEPRCAVCGKRPEEIDEYIEAAATENADREDEFAGDHDVPAHPITPTDYVRREEGTYNPESFQFFCTSCYIRIGMPNGRAP